MSKPSVIKKYLHNNLKKKYVAYFEILLTDMMEINAVIKSSQI